MYGLEQRRVAVETLVKFGYSHADAIAELGYPNRQSLRSRWNDYRGHGEVRTGKPTREPRCTLGMRQAAVDRCLGHGKSLARTMRAMGHPKGRERLARWIGGLAPGQGKAMSSAAPGRRRVPPGEKTRAVAGLGSRDGAAAEVAGGHGVARAAPYAWRRQTLAGDNPDVEDEPAGDKRPVGGECYKLPADEAGLARAALGLRAEVRRLQTEPDVRNATPEMAKKTWAPTRTG